MFRSSLKFLLVGAVVLVAFSAVAQQADAQWAGYYRTAGWGWGCSYSPCYTPCYTSCYTPCCTTVNCDPCGGSWYLGWRPGPVRRLLLGRYRWYRSGYGYACPTYGCCTDSCCSDVSICGSATPAMPQSPTPAQKPVMGEPNAMPTEPAPTPGDLPGMPTKTTSADTSGVLTVWVPYNAEVTINGLKTTSKGSRRQFISHGLKPGFSYKYVVKATLIRDGQLHEDTEEVTLTAGKITAVAFGFNINGAEQVAAVQ